MKQELAPQDVSIVRTLAEKVAKIAEKPVHTDTAERWQRLNDLEPVRPLVRIYQIPWREMNVDDELTLQAESDTARAIEWDLRVTLYRWKHFPVDMVVEPIYETGYAIRSTGQGIRTNMDQIPYDKQGGVSAKHYHCQIADEDDIDKIKMPEVSCDWEATEETFERTSDLLGDTLPVRKQGRVAHNYAPWDRLAEWCNPGQVLIDLITRPEFVHKLMDRLTRSYLRELDQLEEQKLLSAGTGNFGVGQGGLGYTNQLPQGERNDREIRLNEQWGGAMAQIFSEVSPKMHEEFALQYEKKILKRFGLAYYGCCEPLHRKVDIISKHIPNLRKISMSPWVDVREGAEAIDGRFVFSFKPNPAFLATDDRWDRKSAEAELRRMLEATGGKHVEIILKDISTVRFEPQRLWQWADMAMELAREHEG